MINLIPPVAKRKILTEYWTRVATVWLGTLSAVVVIWSVALLPAYVLITTQTKVFARDSAEVKAEVDEYNTSVANLIDTSSKASRLLAQKNAVILSETINHLETLVGTGVTIESYELSRVSDTELQPIIVTGRAATREDLANFRETLLLDPQIESALLPLSNLARDRDIAFSITITLKKSTN